MKTNDWHGAKAALVEAEGLVSVSSAHSSMSTARAMKLSHLQPYRRLDSINQIGVGTKNSRRSRRLHSVLEETDLVVEEDGEEDSSSDDDDDDDNADEDGDADADSAGQHIAAAELALVRHEVNNMDIIRSLSDALECGRALCNKTTGKMDLDTIDVLPIKHALEEVDRMVGQSLWKSVTTSALLYSHEHTGTDRDLGNQLKTRKARHLARTAHIVLRLRQSLLHHNWEAVELALNEAKRVRAERVDNMNDSNYRTRGRSAYTLSSSSTLLSMKISSRTKAIDILQLQSPFHGLDPVALREVTEIQQVFDDRKIVSTLTLAMSRGAATPMITLKDHHRDHISSESSESSESVGQMNTNTIELGELESAIAGAVAVGCQTNEARGMLASAIVVLKVRRAWRYADIMNDASLRGLKQVLDEHVRMEDKSTRIRTQGPSKSSSSSSFSSSKSTSSHLHHHHHHSDHRKMHRIINIDVEQKTTTLNMPGRRHSNQETGGSSSSRSSSVYEENDAEDTMSMGVRRSSDIRKRSSTTEKKESQTESTSTEEDPVRKKETKATKNSSSSSSAAAVNPYNSFPLAQVALHELTAARDETENQDIILLLHSALLTGGPRGDVGRLQTDCMDVDLLSDAIAHAMHHSCRTQQTQELLHTAKIVRTVRDALLHSDWLALRRLLHPIMEALVVKTAANNNSSQSSQQTGSTPSSPPLRMSLKQTKRSQHRREQTVWLDTSTLSTNATNSQNVLNTNSHMGGSGDGSGSSGSTLSITPVALYELRLIAREVLDRQVESVLRDALQEEGKVHGVVGALHLNEVDIDVLDEAMEIVQDVLDRSDSLIPQGDTTTTAMSPLRLSDASTKQMEACQLVRTLRSYVMQTLNAPTHTIGLVGDPWSAMLRVLQTSAVVSDLPQNVHMEMTLIRKEVLDRMSIQRLEQALSRGGPSGDVRRLITTEVTVLQLDAAVRYAEDVRCESVRAQLLTEIATYVRRMRLALLQRDYVVMGVSCDQVATSLQHGGLMIEDDDDHYDDVNKNGLEGPYVSICRELWLVQDILDNIAMAKYLRRGLLEGRVEGEPGLLYNVSSSDGEVSSQTSRNDDASVVQHSQHSLHSTTSASAIRRNSTSLHASHFFAGQEQTPSPMNHLAEEFSDDSMPAMLRPFVETESCDARLLRDAMRQVASLRVRTQEVDVLLKVAASVAALRECLREQNGPNLTRAEDLCQHALFNKGTHENHGGSQSVWLNEETMDLLGSENGRHVLSEFQLVSRDLKVRAATETLCQSLQTGSATCHGGTVDLSTMEIAKLDDALRVAREAGVMTGDGRRMLVAAIGLRRVRAALLQGPDWNQVERALHDMESDTDEYLSDAIKQERIESMGSSMGSTMESKMESKKDSRNKEDAAALISSYRQRKRSNRNKKSAAAVSGGDTTTTSMKGSGRIKSAPHVLIANEIDAVRTEMLLHFQMKEILRDLNIGTETHDLELLVSTLAKATALEMSASTNLHVVTQIYRARELVRQLSGARVRLREALDQFNGNVTLAELEEVDLSGGRKIMMMDDKSKNNHSTSTKITSSAMNGNSGKIGTNSSKYSAYGGRTVVERVVKNHTSIVEVRISRPNQLRQALLHAKRVGYHTSPLGIEVSELLTLMEAYEKNAHEACERGDVVRIRQVMHQSHAPTTSVFMKNSDRAGYRTNTHNDWNNGAEEGERCPLITRETQIKCRRVLNMTKRALNQHCLKSAVKRNHVQDIVSTTMNIKQLFFDEHLNVSDFSLDTLACLRHSRINSQHSLSSSSSSTASVFLPPHTNLRAQWSPVLNAAGMNDHGSNAPDMYHTLEPIRTSLTTSLRGTDVEVAMKMFKNVLGFMDDRKYTYPQTLARELLEACLLHPPLRDELYLQILKQLRSNPDQISERLGYVLLHLCLQTFPPTERIENALEYFLRTIEPRKSKINHTKQQEKVDLVRALHERVYLGPADEQGLPTTDDIAAIRTATKNMLSVREVPPSQSNSQTSAPTTGSRIAVAADHQRRSLRSSSIIFRKSRRSTRGAEQPSIGPPPPLETMRENSLKAMSTPLTTSIMKERTIIPTISRRSRTSTQGTDISIGPPPLGPPPSGPPPSVFGDDDDDDDDDDELDISIGPPPPGPPPSSPPLFQEGTPLRPPGNIQPLTTPL